MGKASKPYVLLLAILAVAAFLRFYELDSVPPGLSHDEAMNGVDALDVIHNGYRPLYFERNQGGREPLFIYLTTLSVYIWGATPYAMRLVPAFIGLLTVTATYALVNRLFGRRTALIASALIALSHWHVHFSRTSFRTISFPLFEILAILLLWKGISSGRQRYFALGGLVAGLAMYTYFSSRLLPVLLALFFAYLAAFHRNKVSWPGIGLFCAVGTLVFVPLGYYYLTHQYIFFARVAQVSALGTGPQLDSWASIWENTRNTLGMFHQLGDIYWRHNLPGKPLFGLIGFGLFLVGLALSVYRARRTMAAALMLIWLGVMLLPSALSVESPSFMRSSGIFPVVFILPALAADAVWTRLAVVFENAKAGLRWLLPVAATIWLVSIGVSTFRDYLGEWGAGKTTYYTFDADMNAIGRYLNTTSGQEPIFLSSKYYQHPSTLFLLRQPLDIRWFNGSQSLVFPDYQGEAIYVFPYSAMPANLDQFFPSTNLIAKASGPDNTPAFVAYRVRPADLRKAAMAVISPKVEGKQFGDTVDILGYRTDREVKPGQTLPLDILWQVKQKPKEGADLAFFSHLVDHKGQMWGLGDANEYLSPEWAPGDLVLGRYDLSPQPDTPPGRYYVDIGMYDRRTGDRLYLSGKEKADHLILGTVKVQSAQPLSSASIRLPLSVSFAKGINLLGYDLEDASGQPVSAGQSMRPGQSVKLTLYWQATTRPDEDYTVFLHLLDGQNKVVAQDDSQPAGNRFPTTFWDPQETVVDEHHLAIDPALPPGDYVLEAGLYLLKSGERLGVLKDGQTVGDHVIPGKLRIENR